MKDTYSTIDVQNIDGVATITINNPPVNVLDVKLMNDIQHFLTDIRNDDKTKVIVFQSANPELFIAHVDMKLIDEPHVLDELAKNVPEGLNPFQAFAEMIRHQPQVTIVKLQGFARGGGAEFVAAVDMSFAAIDGSGLAQCEALMGIIPGGGATQYLSQRMTRGRALEVVLGADLIDAKTAEKYGWINRALPNHELDAFVQRLACNIATLPDGIIAAAKNAIPAEDLTNGFVRESNEWARLFIQPVAEKLIREGLDNGAQTIYGERNLEQLLRDQL
ncbi:enoyl-CoA hydratase/isomerase family protein [Celerinatantimonas sp. MCCC 1A17872]|uniref:enoyl-CoA hydratase/isomerase family protein n=1 Tax=Celerinatantimonas sp. MCCC 1A17872 TaxID=3177514 RepID=UPI0038C13697